VEENLLKSDHSHCSFITQHRLEYLVAIERVLSLDRSSHSKEGFSFLEKHGV
jgi:hypothetical protein